MTVPLNDNIDYDGGIVTWIDNLAGERPSATISIRRSISTCSRSVSATVRAGASSRRRSGCETLRRIIGFQRRLVESGAFADPRSHIYYLPELYCAYFGRCYAAFTALPPARAAGDRSRRRFGFIRGQVLAYVQDDLIAAEMNPFDAALALIALGHSARIRRLSRRRCIASSRQLGEGGRRGPFKAYEWNKMKTPTRILVGGPEVTSAFVLMGLALARRTMMQRGAQR